MFKSTRFAALAMASLGALLSAGVQNRFAGPGAPRKLAPSIATRSWKMSRGQRKTVFPEQTPAQAKALKAAAQAKRDRKGAILTRNAERSAQGYHPDAKWSAMHTA